MANSAANLDFLSPALLLSTVAVDFYGTTCAAILSASKYDGRIQLKCPHLQWDKTGEERRGRGLCLRMTVPTVSNHNHLDLHPIRPPPPRCPPGLI